MRLLLDGAAPEGGNGNDPGGNHGENQAAPNPPHPDLTRPPANQGQGERRDAQPQPTPAQPSPMEVERKRQEAELAELRKYKADIEAQQEAAERERLRKAGDAEQLMSRYEAELKRRDEAVQAERKRYLDSTLDRDLAVELARFPWVDGAMERVAKLVRDELETVERDGRYHTISRESLRPIGDHLKERIEKDPFFKHLLRSDARPGSGATSPTNPGGSGQGDDARPAPADPALNARKGFQQAGRITQGGGIRFG